MPFPQNIKEDALVAAGRHCCLCHRFCGVKIECHHIDPEASGGGDTFENCMPLCFDCHAEVQHYNPAHPKGTRFRPSELRAHRDEWYRRISNTTPAIFDAERREADRKIFESVRTTLPEEKAKDLLDEHCWGQSISKDELRYLYAISDFMDRVDSEFLDPACEGFRSEFKAAYQKFLKSQSFKQISPVTGHPDRFRIPKEWDMHEDQRVRDQFRECMDDLNNLSSEAYIAYTTMIRELRRLLILP